MRYLVIIIKNKFNEDDFKSFSKVSPRGPDYFRTLNIQSQNNYLNNITIGFHRLSIIDTSIKGSQPFEYYHNNRIIYTLCNGEIYNYKELIADHNLKENSSSDCKVLPELYIKYGFEKMLKLLRGEYSIIIIDIDEENNIYNFNIGRDEIGVRSLYYGINDNFICFSSLLKGIPQLENTNCDQFQPGNFIDFNNNNYENIIKNKNLKYNNFFNIENIQTEINNENIAFKMIREELTNL